MFSFGVLRLAQQLGLKIAQGLAVSQEEAPRELLTLAWLLDESHSQDEIRAAVNDPDGLQAKLDQYAFEVDPATLARVRGIVKKTSDEVASVGVPADLLS